MPLSVTQFGIVCGIDASLSATGTALQDNANPFNTSKVTANQDTYINGAGAAGADYKGTSLTFVASNQATLGVGVSTNVTNAQWSWGNIPGGVNNAGTHFTVICGAISAGDAIVVAMNLTPGQTVSSVTDTLGNSYALETSGSNADFVQKIYCCTKSIAAAAAGANTVTVVTSANTTPEWGAAIVTGSPTGWVVDKPGSNPATATTTGTGTACNAAAFTTSNASEVVFAITGVNSSATAGDAAYTVSGISPFSDLVQYKIYTTLQVGVVVHATQTGNAIFIVSTIGLYPAASGTTLDVISFGAVA